VLYNARMTGESTYARDENVETDTHDHNHDQAHDLDQMPAGYRLRKRIRRVFSMILALALVVVVVRGIYVVRQVNKSQAIQSQTADKTATQEPTR
jgi:hypothetical protein